MIKLFLAALLVQNRGVAPGVDAHRLLEHPPRGLNAVRDAELRV